MDPADLLRQRGIQVTAQRLAVLRAVAGQPHITADGGGRGRQGRDRRHLAPVGVRRPRRPGRRRPHPAHPARRVTGALRGSGRRQPPPPDLPRLRPRGRRRLRGRLGALPHGRRRQGLRDRRGRGRLLGPLSGVRGPGPTAPSILRTPTPTRSRPRAPAADGAVPDHEENPRTDTRLHPTTARGQRHHGQRTEVPVHGPRARAARRTATGGRTS